MGLKIGLDFKFWAHWINFLLFIFILKGAELRQALKHIIKV